MWPLAGLIRPFFSLFFFSVGLFLESQTLAKKTWFFYSGKKGGLTIFFFLDFVGFVSPIRLVSLGFSPWPPSLTVCPGAPVSPPEPNTFGVF